jgi:hypothetical protein
MSSTALALSLEPEPEDPFMTDCLNDDTPKQTTLKTTPATTDYRSVWAALPEEVAKVFSEYVITPRRLSSRPHAFTGPGNLSGENHTTYLVSKKPHFILSIDDAAQTSGIPDLWAVLAEWEANPTASRHSRHPTVPLPYSLLHVLKSIRVQTQSLQDARVPAPIQTIQALLPSSDLPFGCCNVVLLKGSDSTGIKFTF